MFCFEQYVSSFNSSSYHSKSTRLSSDSTPPPAPIPPTTRESTIPTFQTRLENAFNSPIYTSPSLLSSSLASSLNDNINASSLASWFLHPASLGYPWTINLMSASNYRYNSLAFNHHSYSALDLASQRNSSIAELRLKAKRHAEALDLQDK